MRYILRSSISSSLTFPATPGIIFIRDEMLPIFSICSNCAYRSFISNLFSCRRFASFSCSFSSTFIFAFSMSESTSPIPSILSAIRLGWNCTRSSVFSPTPANFIGLPVTERTDRAAPPRVSPSSFVRITPVMSSISLNDFATFTAS